MNSFGKPRVTHKPGIEKSRWREGTPQFDISEGVYSSLLEISQPIHMAVNRAYPVHERNKNPKLMYRHADATQEIKNLRNKYKVIVRDDLCSLGKFTRHPKGYDATNDRSTTEFRRAVLGQLFWLKQNLLNYAPIWLDSDEVASASKVLENIYNQQVQIITDLLATFEVAPRLTEKDF